MAVAGNWPSQFDEDHNGRQEGQADARAEIGGMGELIAEPTADVPRAVLITAGVLWGVIAVIFVVLGTAATRARRGHRNAT